MTLIAAVTAVAALLLTTARGPGPRRLRGPGAPVRWSRWWPAPVALVVAAGAVGPRAVAWSGVVALVLGGSWVLHVRRRRGREAAEAGRRVLETCELLAAELRAGRPPGVALALAAEDWPALSPVVEAFTLGADTPDSLRGLSARLPGAGDLRLLAAAWQVAHRTGNGLASAVEMAAEDLRAARSARRVVESELASARATARLVAALPVLVLVMGNGAGGNPWRFLLLTTPGLCCLAGGVALTLAGLWWIEAISAGVWKSP